jgi:antitoxin HicB
LASIEGRAEDEVIGRGRRGIERRPRVRFRVTIQQDEDGVFVAEVPVLPGCLSQGRTRSEAIENIKEAIAAYLESLTAHFEPIPSPISEEIVEVALWVSCRAISGRDVIKALEKVGDGGDHQRGSHIVLRQIDPPHRRLTVPDHDEVAKETLRAIIRQAGLTVEEFKA